MEKIIPISEQQIKEVIKEGPSWINAFIQLWKIAVPEFATITLLTGHPLVHTKTALRILEIFEEYYSEDDLTQLHLLWVDKGFSSNDLVPEWTIDNSKILIS